MSNKNYLLLILLNLLFTINSYLIGVDIGSEFFKICVIKPGKPFMIVENFQSKMKTPTALSLKDDEIIFGADAINKKVRFPKNVFTYFENFLGEKYNSDFVNEFLENYLVSYDLEEDPDRYTFVFNIQFNKKSEKICIEEIYGMLFTYIKHMSESFAKIEITDAYITIPSFFTYKQREALAQGIKMSKLTIDGFVSESLAAAVQFQLKKVYDKEEFLIMYNMGGSYTQVALVSYQTVYQEKNNKTTDLGNEIKVLGEAWNRNLGGNTFNNGLIKLLMKKFDELPARKGKESIQKNKKIYEKFLPHAIKCKEVLSANKNCYVTILGVDQGVNLEASVTREEFIEINKEAGDQIYAPIETVLKNSGLTLDNITSIELIGGSIRIPKVQETIKEKLGEKYENLLGAHMNGDDSMAFGVAYMAANSSRNFKGSRRTFMQNGANAEYKIYLSDYNNSESIIYCNNNNNMDKKEEQTNSNNEENKNEENNNEENNNNSNEETSNKKLIDLSCVHQMKKNTTIFPFRHDFGKARKVSFTHDNDINVSLTETMIYENKEKEILKFSVTGINDLCKQLIKDNITNSLPKIHLRFDYSSSGQISLEAYGEYEEVLYMGKYINEYGSEVVEYRRNFSEKLSDKELEEIDLILNTSKVLSDYEYEQKEKKRINKKLERMKKKIDLELKKNKTLLNQNSTENGTNTENNNSTISTNATDNSTANNSSKANEFDKTNKLNFKDIEDDEDNEEEEENKKNLSSNNTEYNNTNANYTSNMTINLTNNMYNNSINKNKKKQKFISESQKKLYLKKKIIGDKKIHTAKHYFKVDLYHTIPYPLNSSQYAQSLKKIKNFFEVDDNRTKLIEKKNTFETMLYNMKQWIETEEGKAFMNNTEFESTKLYLQNKSDWYEEDGYMVDLHTLEKVIFNMTSHFRRYDRRRQNYVSRYEALNKFYNELNQTNIKANQLVARDPWRYNHFNNTYVPEINKIIKWMNESITKQENMSLLEEPFLTADKIKAKGDAVRKAFYELKQVKKPKEPKDLTYNDLIKDGDVNLEDLMKNSNFTKEEWEKIQESVRNEAEKNNNQTNNDNNNTNNTNTKNHTNNDDLYPNDDDETIKKGNDDENKENNAEENNKAQDQDKNKKPDL